MEELSQANRTLPELLAYLIENNIIMAGFSYEILEKILSKAFALTNHMAFILKHFLQFVLNIEYMFLTAKVEIVQYPELIREPFGTSKDLTCSATGDPPPMITWIKDGTLVRRFQSNLTSY